MQRAHASEQFREGERFYQIVVRTQLKPFHAIANAVARGEKKNGSSRTFVAQSFNEGPAVFFWQHDIDDEQIEFAALRRGKPRLAVVSDLDAKSSFAKTFGQKGRRLQFVFNNEDTHASIYNTKKAAPEEAAFL